jgi:hypothetical protein
VNWNLSKLRSAGVVLVLAAAAAAQVQLGDFEIRGGASLNTAYNATYGDSTFSSHGFTFGGSGAFDGSYYNPKFLSFHLQPYYNQSRANSEYQSISDSSGVLSTFQIFSGSHFPGSISFSKTYNSLSSFGNLNSGNLATSGSGSGFNISWSALFPEKPTFTVSFSQGAGSGEVVGTKQESQNSNRTLTFRSAYSALGFRMRGSYLMAWQHFETPGFLIGQNTIESQNDHDMLSFGADRRLPLHGNFYSNLSRSHYQNFYQGASDGTNIVDDVNAGASFNPFRKLSFNVNGTYTDNLFAAFRQEISPTAIAPISLGGTSRAFTLSGGAGYQVWQTIGVTANAVHVEQFYFGGSHESTYFTGSAHGSYQKPLFGMLNWSVAGMDNATQEGNTSVGFMTSLSMTRRLPGDWELIGNFDYDQNVQTMLVDYTSSAFRWRGQAAKRFSNHWYWNGTVGGMKTVFSQLPGSGNRSESVSSGFGNGRWAVSGNYSQSAGRSILTSEGLQAVPVPIPGVPLNNIVLFDARSYGVSATSSPKRRLLGVFTYQHATSNTSSVLENSLNENTYVTARIEYQLRRLSVLAGYSRLSQGISAANALPVNVNSYYIGINRWFNIF